MLSGQLGKVIFSIAVGLLICVLLYSSSQPPSLTANDFHEQNVVVIEESERYPQCYTRISRDLHDLTASTYRQTRHVRHASRAFVDPVHTG